MNELTTTDAKKLLWAQRDRVGVLLGKTLTPERFLALAYRQVAQNAELLRCSKQSLIEAIVRAAEYNLELGFHANLIPRGGLVCFEANYKGLCELARRSGEVRQFYAKAVFEADEFSVQEGTEKQLVHRPDLKAPRTDTKDNPLTHVYSICIYKDGSQEFDWMTRSDVDAVRNLSRAANSPAWKQHYPEMAKKTVLKRHSKTLPASFEFRGLVDLDNESEFDFTEKKPRKLDPVRDMTPAKEIPPPAADGDREEERSARFTQAAERAMAQQPRSPDGEEVPF